ncbi:MULTISPECIES: Gfo/Idh/MocA family protein [Streptomyces]|uniref:Gfo/Idh/MocA family protein n=1 Tax=Streptomyces TaxID=1883 RepID=UPI0036C7880E
MTPPLRVGVLGCADIALRRMLPALAAAPTAALAAVASRDPAKARQAAAPYGCRAVHGYRALLDDDTVDAVYIPLPAALHAPWTEAALTAGKHVLAEKPLSTDAATTARLTDLARDRGRVLMENVMFVHHGLHRAVRDLVADGAIGELRSFHAAFCVPRRDPGDIRLRADLGGGALADTGVYPLRAALHHLGTGLRTVGAALTHPHDGDPTAAPVETSGSALLTTPEGVTAHLAFGLDHAYLNRYELHGSHGRLTVDRAFTPPADHEPVIHLETPERGRALRVPAEDQVANTVAAFTAAVRNGTPPDPVTLVQATLLDELRAAAGTPTAPAGRAAYSNSGGMP